MGASILDIGIGDIILLCGGVAFNLGLTAYDVWFSTKMRSLEMGIAKIYDLAKRSVNNGEGHYDSLCNHIQTNREIGLDIYEKVKEK